MEGRTANRKEGGLKNASFCAMKTFCQLLDEVKLPSDLTPQALKDCRFVEEKKNLISYGNVGTGKTHLATAMVVEGCKKGLSIKFFCTAALVYRLAEAKRGCEVSRISKGLSKLDLLIFDGQSYRMRQSEWGKKFPPVPGKAFTKLGNVGLLRTAILCG